MGVSMKIIRHQDEVGQICYSAQQSDGAVFRIAGELFGRYEVTKTQSQVVKLLAPVEPTAIWCVGLNYRRHAEESGIPVPEFPVIFAKGPNSIQNPGDPILIPKCLKSDEVDYEGELVVVIGKACKNVSRQSALDYVFGYCCGNDVSARDWQLKKGGGQWCRGKTFDTFAPLGPCLATKDAIPNPNNLRLQSILNRKVVQDCNTNDMIFDVPSLIEFLSGSTTLLPGTVIFTGTPHGVGMAQKPPRWLRPGETITVEIEKIGSLRNPVDVELSSNGGNSEGVCSAGLGDT
jgi:2-keto-4-pentenoate hydratase/2-oxohepta-3-ene-1,7-dioic acid hydratase in catechol pathway